MLRSETLHHGGHRGHGGSNLRKVSEHAAKSDVVNVLLVLLMLSCVPLSAQQAQTPTQAPPTFYSGTKLIVETVRVKNQDGKPIEGLTAKDFTLTEDGVPQTISF